MKQTMTMLTSSLTDNNDCSNSSSSSSRNVRFADELDIHEIPALSTMPSKEKNDLWISVEERKVTNDGIKRLLNEMNRIEAKDDSPFVRGNNMMYRGLEGKTTRNSRDKKSLTTDALYTVFGEQSKQRKEGIQCSERISAAYSAVTAGATLDAVKVGLKDAQWIDDQDEEASVSTTTTSTTTTSTPSSSPFPPQHKSSKTMIDESPRQYIVKRLFRRNNNNNVTDSHSTCSAYSRTFGRTSSKARNEKDVAPILNLVF